jgi:hypothetical protein
MGRVWLAGTLAWCVAQPAVATEAWRRVDEADGVVVDVREVEGMDFPEFRGIGVVSAPMLHVAAVLADLTRTCQWTARCAAVREVSRKSEFDRIFYTRTSAPFPVSDRDAVLHATFTGNLKEQQELVIRMVSTTSPLEPVHDGVVRIPYLRGQYTLTAASPTQTRVEYRVIANPGGWLPTWLVRQSSKDIPRDTLLGLRKQSARTQGQYEGQIRQWLAMFQ